MGRKELKTLNIHSMPYSYIMCIARNRHPPGDSVLRVREHLLPDGHVALGDAGQRRRCRHLWQQDTRSVQGGHKQMSSILADQ
jgi:hypothetical protein